MAGIYIHIPFCVKRCGYCDFFSSTSIEFKKPVLKAICREIEQRKGWLDGQSVETIYIGGGTPSLCTPNELEALLCCVKDNFHVDNRAEITVEVNPDDLSGAYAEGLRAAGFNRLSIGVQSFNDNDLVFMNRRHDAHRATEAIGQAQDAGFDNISIDLIYGVPGMEIESWRRNVEMALSMDVQHISAYHLGIEDGTPFGTMAHKGELTPVSDHTSQQHYLLLHELTVHGGFEHYEISNFAHNGYRSIHNSNYWKGVPYLGIGPSAHSFSGVIREWNNPSLSEYLEGPARTDEELTTTDRYNEMVMLSLRTIEGLSIKQLSDVFGKKIAEESQKTAQEMVAKGLLEFYDSKYRIPFVKFLISDSIIGEFFKV